jgi:hypothetical protein
VASERDRVRELGDDITGWRRWGPYLADRSWGTVREDYSGDGNAWRYLTYDAARAKAYRWGEDGIAGICDRYQLLCFAPAFWNERDPHLKERFFGVDPSEGNHGEDVKEYYFHVDNTPSHSYMCLLYKYPQERFPYERLVDENRRRGGQGSEFELIDTGIFDDDRYFDIFVEYAKADPEDIAIRITAHNRGPVAAPLHVLPTLWFRNTWAWSKVATPEPSITAQRNSTICLVADDSGCARDPNMPEHYQLGTRYLYGPSAPVLFTDNETNGERTYGRGHTSRRPHTKDAFHRALCEGDSSTVRPDGRGTKAALQYRHVVPAKGSVSLRLRFTAKPTREPLVHVDSIIAERKSEADAFFEDLAPKTATADEKLVQRRAIAGLLWTKQSYLFDVARWLDGDNDDFPPPASREAIRNSHWRHLNSMRVMAMPDKWEYPWFAAWDLAFHCVALALVDARFAKDQLWVLLFEQFQHPSGQLPAYEWEFGDLNPPVHAWAVFRVYTMEVRRTGKGDRVWLERCFHKLLVNFASWVNKVDRDGNNVFEGGFLGLDNITIVDRSANVTIEQADATGWMGMFCLNLMRIALELAKENPVYEGMATKFFQHYVYVAHAIKHMGRRDVTLFDYKEGFFYDRIQHRDGSWHCLRVRSLVGLIPLFAVERLELGWIEPFKEFTGNLMWFLKNRSEMVSDVIHQLEGIGGKPTYLLTIVDDDQLHRILGYLFDENEFLSRYGVRSLSKIHEKKPFWYDGLGVAYEPAESTSKMKGGNSNWRGPIWFPTTFLMIESLRKLGTAFGKEYVVRTDESGKPVYLVDMARDIARRMIDIFRLDEHGQRPVFGGAPKFANDPLWRDHPLFYEYFHGDNGAGIGASHQTGWTALVANLIDEWTAKK